MKPLRLLCKSFEARGLVEIGGLIAIVGILLFSKSGWMATTTSPATTLRSPAFRPWTSAGLVGPLYDRPRPEIQEWPRDQCRWRNRRHWQHHDLDLPGSVPL
jgi:hypothetical protein